MVVEPPSRTVLDLRTDLAVVALEASANRIDGGIVAGVERIKHHLRKRVRHFKGVEKGKHVTGTFITRDGVKPAVRTELFEVLVAVVADNAVMQLHNEVTAGKFLGEEKKQIGLVFVAFFGRNHFSVQRFLKDRVHLVRIGISVRNVPHSVVGCTAAERFKIFDSADIRRKKRIEIAYLDLRRVGQRSRDVFGKARKLDVYALVGTEGGQDFGFKGLVGGDLLMITNDGTIIRIPVDGIPVYSRTAGGVIVMRLTGGAKVVNFTKVAKEEEEAAEEVDETETNADTEEAEIKPVDITQGDAEN